jgi:hypothetical protein
VEANLAGAGEWDVAKSPYVTQAGEHPHMADLARQPGHPGGFSGDWGDPAPVSDGKNYTGSERPNEMRHRSWGNIGGKDIFPDLENPFAKINSADEYTKPYQGTVLRGTDDGLGQASAGGSESWPGLSNPYLPKSMIPHVNSDNRVD